MRLPDLSFSMTVGRLRHIQAVHEPLDSRNPDTHVRRLLPLLERWRLAWMSRKQLEVLRKDPFYYYLVARTRYYHQILGSSIAAGVRLIVNVGTGSDTRAHRFALQLRQNEITVIECDQQASIQVKEKLARRFGIAPHIEYLAIDLNDETWPSLERVLNARRGDVALVLMEGVSPYVNQSRFESFLRFVGGRLKVNSFIAYDYKLSGVNDRFGLGGRTTHPFRLPESRKAVTDFHARLGLRVTHLESSGELCARLVPRPERQDVFGQDALLQLQVGTHIDIDL
jgi:methyltransferase (TIGR00027 family)